MQFGENLYVLGNDACLGSWCMDRAIPMQWTDGNVWSLSLALPNGQSPSPPLLLLLVSLELLLLRLLSCYVLAVWGCMYTRRATARIQVCH